MAHDGHVRHKDYRAAADMTMLNRLSVTQDFERGLRRLFSIVHSATSHPGNAALWEV